MGSSKALLEFIFIELILKILNGGIKWQKKNSKEPNHT